MRKFILTLFTITSFAICTCKQSISGNTCNVQIDFRFGNKFVSYKFNKLGEGYALKGHCTNYTGRLERLDSTLSKPFKFDTVDKFNMVLLKLRNNPVLNHSSTTDGPRTEIYYEGKKIYDVYFNEKNYWDLFTPIMDQMPEGYSPFRQDNNAFN